jgi:3-hydroxyisobutyrate dehydrogenase-like beta-hydroxyacid dehydrogenase
MDVAVLGMGQMGRALAARLLEGGHRVTVWNRSTGKAAELVSAGAREAAGVADAVQAAQVVITMLANDDAVRAVALGELRAAIGETTVYVDCSTVSPALAGELGTAFPRYVAMPIVGNPIAVRAGQAVLLPGGDAATAQRLHTVFSSLSSTVRQYDTPPLALSAKLATNLLLLSQITALAESFAVGRCGGQSKDQLRDLLGTSPLVAPGLKNRFEGILGGTRDGWWSTALGAKDAGLALDLAHAAHLELPEATVVKDLYERAAASGLDHADVAAVTELYRART